MPPDPLSDPLPERTDYTKPSVIAGGLIAFAIIVGSNPVFIFLLPFALIAMAALYFFAEGNRKKAQRLAQRHLGAERQSTLNVDLTSRLSDAVVMNDWGVVCVQKRKRPVELAWSQIVSVDEPEIAVLRFRDAAGERFRIDLSQDRYFLAIWTLHGKIPDRIDFLVDPVTGRSTVLRKLEGPPLEWRGRWGSFAIGRDGVKYGSTQLQWHEIRQVEEVMISGDEANSHWELTFVARGFSFTIRSTVFDDGRQIGNSGYDLIKSILSEQIGGNINFQRRAPAPRERAIEEFKRYQDAITAGLSLALKSRKFGYLEKYYSYMIALVNMFSLESAVDADSFFRDYSDLLAAMNRPDEAQDMRARIRRSGSGSV